MKFTRYEIQAYTEVYASMMTDDEPGYRWIPLPELRPADYALRCKIAGMREDDGRFKDAADARSVYAWLKAEYTPHAVLRIRRVVVQEVYTTVDGVGDDVDNPLLTRIPV